MFWTNVKLIYLRELRDQFRDRRTLFTVVVLPLLLYPLMGMLVFQVQQFLKEHNSKVRIVGTDGLPDQPRLIENGKLAEKYGDSSRLEVELVKHSTLGYDELRKQTQSDIRLGVCDVVVFFPPDFAERLAAFHNGQVAEPAVMPQPDVISDSASDKSKVARQRIEGVILRWRDAIGGQNRAQRHIPEVAAHPFELKHTDVSEVVRRRAALWSKILPFILM